MIEFCVSLQIVNPKEDKNVGMLLTADAAGTMSGIVMVVYIALIFAFIYFMMIRPQKKEQKRMAAMMSSLEIGDSVLTNSGFYGVIIDISDDTVTYSVKDKSGNSFKINRILKRVDNETPKLKLKGNSSYNLVAYSPFKAFT